MASSDESELAHRFVDGLADYAIVIVDTTGKILTWNAGARALLGYAAGEAVGRNFAELYSKLDPTTTEATATITEDAPWSRRETNRELVRKDGSRLEANIVLKRIADASNRTVGFGLIAHDIDRSRRIAAALPAPLGEAMPSRGKGKILVVDDNERVLGIAVDQLTSLGYRVIWALSGAEASTCCSPTSSCPANWPAGRWPPRRWKYARGSRCCSRRAISKARSWAGASSRTTCSFWPSRTASRNSPARSRKS
jgi:PAS domain S-box-containing protein